VETPEHVVLLTIDALGTLGMERIDLPALKGLAASGAYCKECYNLPPATVRSPLWKDIHDSSPSNPTLVAGTALISADTRLVQQVFWPKQPTVNLANTSFASMSRHFTVSITDGAASDDEIMEWATLMMKQKKPVYMRIHLQGPGKEARRSLQTKEDVPWRHDVWAKDSPYRKAIQRAGQLTGEFEESLKEMGLREKTFLVVTSDHGISSLGRHPEYDPECWRVPLIMVGPGIKKGALLDYAEGIDIVPTVCHMLRVDPPNEGGGRILTEALTQPPAQDPPHERIIKKLDFLLVAFEELYSSVRPAAATLLQRHQLEMIHSRFHGMQRFPEWPALGTLKGVYEHDQKAYDDLLSLAREWGVQSASTAQ